MHAADESSGEESSFGMLLDVDPATALRGRVLSVFGLSSSVQSEAGEIFHCATRRLLKTLSTEQRNVVAAGDRVLFRPVPHSQPPEGMIERVEPRHGIISRAVRGRQHVLVTNVDQLLIIASAAEPHLKPNLVDRLLLTAEKGRVPPVICINKVDLVDMASLQPLVGVYGRMGYQVLLLSASSAVGNGPFPPPADRPRERAGRAERGGQVVAVERDRSEPEARAWRPSAKTRKRDATRPPRPDC